MARFYKYLKRFFTICALTTLILAALAYVADPPFARYTLKNTPRFISSLSIQQVKDITTFFLYWDSVSDSFEFNAERSIFTLDPAMIDAEKRNDLDRAGQLAFHQGHFEKSIELLERYHSESGEKESSLFWLAMAYQRLGEVENCLSMLIAPENEPTMCLPDGSEQAHPPMCTLPLQKFHSKREPSEKAMAIFRRLLDEYDSSNVRYKWLLNFTAMSLDSFPQSIPPTYLVNDAYFDFYYGKTKDELAQKHSNLRWVDRAKAFGVDTFDAGKGVAIEDFDRDGDLDIITGGYYTPTRLYDNIDGKEFVDKSASSGLEVIKGAHIITAADYDNDGWIDVLISHPGGTGPNSSFSLMRNQGDGTFTNVTVASGLLTEEERSSYSTMTWTTAWSDIDTDGDLDLFIANWQGFSPFSSDAPRLTSRLYLNEEGHFNDITKSSGLHANVVNQNILGADFGDFDNDGLPDLALTALTSGFPVLYKNVDGTYFQETDLINTEQEIGFMVTFLDANHDGKLDLFYGVAATADSVYRDTVFSKTDKGYGYSRLWLQGDQGTFEQCKPTFEESFPAGTMGANFGDLNNDGAFDYYLGTGAAEAWNIQPNLMYLGILQDGQPTGAVENISSLEGVGTIQKGHGIVFFDFDNDGDQDIYSSLGGFWPADAWPNQLFVNESSLENNWVKIRLKGTRSNAYGIGAKIKVTAQNSSGKLYHRHYYMNNKTGFGSAPYLAHIGLYDAIKIINATVLWPGDTIAQHYELTPKTLNVLEEQKEP